MLPPSSILLGIPPFEEGVRRQVIEFHNEDTDFHGSGSCPTQIQQRPSSLSNVQATLETFG